MSAKPWASVHTLHMQSRDNVRVQSAMQWTSSVHTLVHMRIPVITFVFQVLYAMDFFGTYFGTHAQTRDNVRVPSAIRNGLLRYTYFGTQCGNL